MLYHLGRYRETLEKLRTLGPVSDSSNAAQRLTLESELRQFGAQMLTEASNVVDQERLRIHTWLETSMVTAVAVLIIYLAFVVFIAFFITKQIIRPFGRFEGYTRRIAAGDFALIMPARKYRDEFTNLAIALNYMMMELHRHEQQLIQSRKMAAIGNLTAGIAHELNNPLNNISLTTESLIEDFDHWSDEEKMKMLRTIEAQLERTSNTVANLLDFTRRDESSFERISVNDVLTRTVNLMSNEISLNGIELDLRLGKNLPPVWGNAHDLQQVFLNLLLNAIQAMPDKGTLGIRSFAANESVRIDVSDTGVGIPAEHRDRVFDPFFTTKDVGKGTGLGLSVSYGIIKKHHGHLSVASEVGKGSTFSVVLPVTGGTVQEEEPENG
jgi:signal transduction histidine kinase